MISPAVRLRLEFTAKAFLNASFCGAVIVGALRLHERRLEDPRERVELGAWSMHDAPQWLDVDDVVALREASGLSGWQMSWHDRSRTAALRAGLELPAPGRRSPSDRRPPAGLHFQSSSPAPAVEFAKYSRKPNAAVSSDGSVPPGPGFISIGAHWPRAAGAIRHAMPAARRRREVPRSVM